MTYFSMVIIILQLFHACLAPDSTGDGTGCDNMTAVIVELNQKLKRKMDIGDDNENEVEGSGPHKKSKDLIQSQSSSSSC